MKLTFSSIALLTLLAVPATVLLAQDNEPSVLLVSFDGFRYDYIDQYDLKNFKALRHEGTSAEGLIPCYPSLTFPNHYSIVTGMRPARHGLVDNSFYDSALDRSYSISDRNAVADPRFYGGTPLWRLAKQAGMKTASYFWVGSETSDKSQNPDTFFPYDGDVPFVNRIDSVLQWLSRKGTERPRLITLYFDEPDHVSHDHGPNAFETREVLLKMDALLGYLSEGLRTIEAPVNLILVSDHGMAELTVREETYVFLDELYDVATEKSRTVVGSTLAHLYINDRPTLDSMYTLLAAKQDRYKVYRRSELPAHLNYGNHYRIGDLVIIAEPYHYIRRSDRKKLRKRVKMGAHFGVHGFDPQRVTEMRGLFLAHGPQVTQGLKLGLVRNIDIYPFVVRILGLPLPDTDGDPSALEAAYRSR